MKYELKLTSYERNMLKGKYGEAKQQALKFIVNYAQTLGAQELCEISKAQLFVGAYKYMDVFEEGNIDALLSEMYLNTTKVCKIEDLSCFCQTDAAAFDPKAWEELGISIGRKRKDDEILKRFKDSGIVIADTCTSYLCGFLPIFGEHYVSTESHAVLLINSLWGGRANADSIEASICAAICGRTPKWGFHLPENRKGTHVFEIKCDPRSVHDWDLLGFVIGKQVPVNGVPIIIGSFKRPSLDQLKSFFAAMATSGGVELCHIVGITPEALTFNQATNHNTNLNRIIITSEMINKQHQELTNLAEGKLNYISLGCPHYSINQIHEVAQYLKGKKIASEITLHIWTAPAIKFMARESGFVDIITQAGGEVLTSSCPLIMEKFEKWTGIALDSCKQTQYVRSATTSPVYFGTMKECLDSAISGEWEGKNKSSKNSKSHLLRFKGTGVIPGTAEGLALISKSSIQGWSGLDPTTGVITEKGHPFYGYSIKDSILILSGGKGSTGWATHFHELRVAGITPAGFIFPEIDSRTAVACVVTKIPAIKGVNPNIFDLVKNGDKVKIDGSSGKIEVFKS